MCMPPPNVPQVDVDPVAEELGLQQSQALGIMTHSPVPTH